MSVNSGAVEAYIKRFGIDALNATFEVLAALVLTCMTPKTKTPINSQ